MRNVMDATGERADVRTLASRRRLTHLVAAALLAVVIIALISSPSHDGPATAGTMVGGISLILLASAVVVGLQYTIRIRLRRAAQASAQDAGIPRTSVAFQPAQELRSAQLLLASVLPKIEQVNNGVTSTAEQTRAVLDQTARQIVLQEQVLATLTGSGGRETARTAEMQRNLQTMADRLRSGVDQYTHFAQQASMASVSLGDLNGGDAIQDATDQLTGLTQGLQEVQRISDNNA